MTPGSTRLLQPSAETLPGHVDALQRGWSPDNVRGAAAAQESLERIAAFESVSNWMVAVGMANCTAATCIRSPHTTSLLPWLSTT